MVTRPDSVPYVGSATEGFLVEKLEEHGRLGIGLSGRDGTTGVNDDSQFPSRGSEFHW